LIIYYYYSYRYLDLGIFTSDINVISYVLLSRYTVTATSQGQGLDPPVWPRTRTWLRGHKHQQHNWLAITVPLTLDTPQENYTVFGKNGPPKHVKITL